MTIRADAVLWLVICGAGILFALPNWLNAGAVMQTQIAQHINGLRSLIVRNHVRTATLRLIELACLVILAVPTVAPVRWPGWVFEVLLFAVVLCLTWASIADWRDRRMVVSGKVHE